MKKQYIFLFIAVIFGLLTACQNPQTKSQQQPYLIVVSMDGFRWDYTDSVPTPNFDRLAQKGVHATSMQVSFPSKTFPNHYTLATGLTPDHHGIVNNNFYAPDLDEHYSLGKRSAVEDGRFYGGEPIWNTAKKNGIKTASFFWVGSEANIQGMRPDYWKRYNGKIPFKQRVDTVMHWLNLPAKQRPHLIMWYAHEPDHTGHATGPHSPQTDSVVMLMDELLGYFMDRLAQQPMADSVNVIITSDHGMALTAKTLLCKRLERWRDYNAWTIATQTHRKHCNTAPIPDVWILPWYPIWAIVSKAAPTPSSVAKGLMVIRLLTKRWTLFFTPTDLLSKKVIPKSVLQTLLFTPLCAIF